MFKTILRKPFLEQVSTKNVYELCKKDPRNKDENIFIAYYLINKIGYFSQRLERILIPNLAAKLTCEHYKRGEFIIKTGQEADWLFIMHEGLADVIIKVTYLIL